MKKACQLSFILLFLFLVQPHAAILSSASLVTKSQDSASYVDETKSMQKELMLRVSKMTVKEYEVFTGKKMNLINRIAFKAYKKKLAKRANMAAYDDETEGFQLGSFAGGFLFGLIGVLVVYLTSGDSNKRKWAWIGFGSFAVIFGVLLLLAASGN